MPASSGFKLPPQARPGGPGSASEQLAQIRRERAAAHASKAAISSSSSASSSSSSSSSSSYSFASSSSSLQGEAAEAAAAAASGKAKQPEPDVGLLSYNIWFEQEHTFPRRMNAIAAICCAGGTSSGTNGGSDGGGANGTGGISGGSSGLASPATPPAVVGLQEVTPDQLELLRPPLARAGYQIEVQAGVGTSLPYFVALATRRPVGPLVGVRTVGFACGSMMGRALLMGRCAWAAGAELVVGTVHLESWVGRDHETRVIQLREGQLVEAARAIEAEVHSHGCCAGVLMGDLNWDDNKQDDPLRLVGSGWVDAWQSAGAREVDKYSYDGRRNKMLSNSFRTRLDRCLVYTNSRLSSTTADDPLAVPAISAMSLVGTRQVNSETMQKQFRNGNVKTVPLFPSDHFGLSTTLSWPSHQSGVGRKRKSPFECAAAGKASDGDDVVVVVGGGGGDGADGADDASDGGAGGGAGGRSRRDSKGTANKRHRSGGGNGSGGGNDADGGGATGGVSVLESGTSVYRGGLVPHPFKLIQGSILGAYLGGASPSTPSSSRSTTKIACFDFDGTLATRDFQLRGPAMYEHRFPHCYEVLAKLDQQGYSIVIASNENIDRLKNASAIQKAMEEKCGRLQHWHKGTSVPVLFLVALSKDNNHKSIGTGMWDAATSILVGRPGYDGPNDANGYGAQQRSFEGSFHVGDAAGRPRDHSDDDRAFARRAGLKFYTETEFFEQQHRRQN